MSGGGRDEVRPPMPGHGRTTEVHRRRRPPSDDLSSNMRLAMSRIIAGAGKGRRLKTAAGDATRPTGARVRQSLFDILAPLIPGCRFLDAFAGNGGVGLEALSRGAAKVVLVDKAAPAVEAAKENARALAARGGRGAGLPAGRPNGDRGPRRPGDAVRRRLPGPALRQRPLRAAARARSAKGPFSRRAGWWWRSTSTSVPLPETIGALTRTREKRVGDHCLSFYRRATRGSERSAGARGERTRPESGRDGGGDEEEAS